MIEILNAEYLLTYNVRYKIIITYVIYK